MTDLDLDLPATADRELRTRFRRETRCMSALYEHGLEGVDARKISVSCGDDADVTDQDGVVRVSVGFDVAAYEQADDAGKRRLAIAALHAGALRAAEVRGWDPAPFEAALAAVIEKGYRNEWTFGKPRQSQDRRHFATLTCAHEPDHFRASITITNLAREELVRTLALDELPSDFAFAPKLGKLTWIAKDCAALLAHDGTIVKKVVVPKPKKKDG